VIVLRRDQDRLASWLEHRVALEPEQVIELGRRFPDVTFSFTPWTDLDGCSGCPEGPWDPAESAALLTYRWHGHLARQPVAGCCIESELRSLVASPNATELAVSLLYFETRAVAA
jgi:hypothetical protein